MPRLTCTIRARLGRQGLADEAIHVTPGVAGVAAPSRVKSEEDREQQPAILVAGVGTSIVIFVVILYERNYTP
jgi:hypothetical protein